MIFSNNNNQTFKVAIYIRLSREDGDKGESESIGNQRDIIRRYIKENNLQFIDEYVDDGFTGTNFNRPGFQRLLCHNPLILRQAAGAAAQYNLLYRLQSHLWKAQLAHKPAQSRTLPMAAQPHIIVQKAPQQRLHTNQGVSLAQHIFW